MAHGFSHVGLSTHDMERTIAFYEGALGFKRLVDNVTHIEEGGTLRQVYFDVGGGAYIVFMEPKEVAGISSDYDTGINGALGVPGGMYHFAFKVLSLEELEAKRRAFEESGLDVSSIIDLGTAKGIFLTDPNGLQLEWTCQTREFREDDLHQTSRASLSSG